MLDAQDTPQPPPTIRLSDYRPPDWLVPDVALAFDLDADRTVVRARLTVERHGDHDRPLVLDGADLALVSIKVDGVPRNAAPDGETLTLVIAGDRAVIETEVAIAPATNTRMMGLYQSGGKLVTQCEAEGFRRITYFPDRPDVLSRYSVRLAADPARYPVLLSNGEPGPTETLPDGRHAVGWTDPWPKPSYLFALVAGDLGCLADHFTTMSGRAVELGIWAGHDEIGRARHAMAALKASMAWDERVYGREYDLDRFNIVAVNDFNAGAMENKGLNIFNSKYILADAETATDGDFDAVEAVVAHEYFHNWTGNRVTCRDWFQLSLKEGLTVFRDQQFSADQGSPAVNRIDEVRSLRAGQFPEDAGPLAHPIRPDHYIEIGNFYTSTVYNKGAEVIRMLRTLLGAETYRRGADLYFDRHDGQAVTCDDWLAAMADASGRDLSLFRRWYEQAGTPRIAVATDQAEGRVTLRFTQTVPATPGQPVKRPMLMPFRIALIGRQSGKRVSDDRVVELTGETTETVFDDIAEPVLASVNRDFSAPVIVEQALGRDDLAFLARADDDPLARWEAWQRLASDVLATDDDPAALVAAVAATLAARRDGMLDAAFVAEAVVLPSEAIIGDQAKQVDVEAIHRRREAARAAIATGLGEAWWEAYRTHAAVAAAAGPALTPDAKGARALANVALAYLVRGQADGAVAAARAQYDGAATMTARIGALGALINTDTAERDACLADFHARFAGNPDVVDKWFSVQALSTRADTPDRVRALMAHPDFSIANPNRLRALIGAFTANQVRFHAAGGGGYSLVADQLIAVDKLNPQSAARLVTPLGRWRRFDAVRAGLMKAELQRIVATPGLSKDVFEVASRSLA